MSLNKEIKLYIKILYFLNIQSNSNQIEYIFTFSNHKFIDFIYKAVTRFNIHFYNFRFKSV